MADDKAKPRRRTRPSPRTMPSAFHTGLSRAIVDQWRSQRPDVSSTGFEVALLSTRLSILINHLRDSAKLDRAHMRGAGHELLYALRRPGPPYAQRPTDLYRLLGVTSGAVTYTIRILTERGLIRTVDDPDDGRSHLIQLTAAGLKLADNNVGEMASMMRRACAGLSEEQQKDILSAMLLLADTWERHVDALNASEGN